MLRRMILAAAALAMTTPAMATCLEDGDGAQCDIFLDEYRANEVPVGTLMVWPENEFLVQDFDYPGFQGEVDTFVPGDVFYWDGDQAFVVPEITGPPVKIAAW